MSHRPVGSNAVGSSSGDDAFIDVLLRTLQQSVVTYNMLLHGPEKLLKMSISLGGSGPPSNTWFLGPTRITHSNDISIGSAGFAELTNVKNRDATLSVAIGRLWLFCCDAA